MLGFRWWRDRDNREAARTIADVLKVAVPAVLAVAAGVYAYMGFGRPNPVVHPPQQSVLATEENAIASALPKVIFLQALEEREARVRAELDAARDMNRLTLQAQLDAITSQKADLQRAYEAALGELEDLRERLQDIDQRLPERSDEPPGGFEALFLEVLLNNDWSPLDDALHAAQSAGTDDIRLIGDIAFARGRIAAHELRVADAAGHFMLAAQASPSDEALAAASYFLAAVGPEDGAAAARQLDEFIGEPNGEAVWEYRAGLVERARTLEAAGEFGDALTLYQEAFRLTAVAGELISHFYEAYLEAQTNLIGPLAALGRMDEAGNQYIEVMSGIAHDTLELSLEHVLNLTSAEVFVGGYSPEDVLIFRDLVRPSPVDPSFMQILSNRASLLEDAGRIAEAEAHRSSIHSILSGYLGPADPATIRSATDYLAFLEHHRPDATEAEQLRGQLDQAEASEQPPGR